MRHGPARPEPRPATGPAPGPAQPEAPSRARTRVPAPNRALIRAPIRALTGALALPALAQAPDRPAPAQAPDRTLLQAGDGLTLRWHLQAGINAVGERALFWNFGETVAGRPDYAADTAWLELYVKPGLSFEQALPGGGTAYGKVSAVTSYTAGTDAYDTGDTGRITLEEAYPGLRGGAPAGLSFDVSLGRRELKLGTGMLVSNGGSSGFERGALKFGPRKAWERAAIARLSAGGVTGGVTGTAFYLDPDERPASDGGNALAGIDLRHDAPRGGYLGATWVTVTDSDSAYPQAAPGGSGAPTVIPGAREDTRTLNIYGRTTPFSGALETTFLAADLALQRNDRIDLEAWAGRVQLGRAFPGLPWAPVLTYSYQTFSGDDPDTATLERFDPLYYQGAPSAWATGSKSSMVFINSNVQSHGLSLRMQPTERDTVTVRYAHIRANELNAPVQFGQATRVDVSGDDDRANVITGVTDAHLADDGFVEYNRVINRNTFLTAGFSVSFPGAGITSTVAGDTPTWTGVVVNF